MADFKHAWDRRTGKKLPYKVPASHFKIFSSTLSPTPVQKRQDREHPTPTPSPNVASVVEVVNKQEGK
ncbi:hypothetical protein [Brevibacterium sp. RIT 803]|uniref:hypothetical protein n=1 Tax=Brevibacterium sp. RIT 803 TaxID=2810210 RepID=UPI00194FA9A8|nr:hypothetical protein [Brevibacterium sp. RIT 803]MBM6588775.1 hypothetical protein [Brevibacterium sp. RIT 803]